jgi:predicted enzyme related to lactoylglutathione lyase
MSETPAHTGVDPKVARLGGVTYLHIPATDRARSAEFYAAVFGWRLHGDPQAPSFEDGTAHVIGRWVTDQAPTGDDGVRPYIYVDSVQATLEKVTARGGEVAREPYAEGGLIVATIRDPAGNTIGIWQQSAG